MRCLVSTHGHDDRAVLNLGLHGVDGGRLPQGLTQRHLGGVRPERELVEFADGSDRKLVDDCDRFRRGRPLPDPVIRPSEQVLRPGGCTRSQCYVGDRYLSRIPVGSADRRCAGHVRVGEEGVLDDCGVDVVAASDDQVFGATGELDDSVLIDLSEVAGVEPAVPQFAEAVEREASGPLPVT